MKGKFMKNKFFFVLAATALLASCGPTNSSESSSVVNSSESEISSSEVVEEISITLDQTEVTVEVEATVAVKATVSGSMNKNVTWTSANPEIATVSGGTITGVAAGTTTVTAASVADPTKTATVAVTVTEPAVEITKIADVMKKAAALTNDGRSYTGEFTTRGIYTGCNNVVGSYNGSDQHVARYIQDGNNSLLIYKTLDDLWEGIEIGDIVQVTTDVCNYYGLAESGVGKTKEVKKIASDDTITVPTTLNVSATVNPTITSADVSRKAHLDAVTVSGVSTSSSGNMTVKFLAGEAKTEETLYLKGSDNDLEQWAEVKAGSIVTLDTWVGVGYNGEGFQYTYFDNLTVDNSKLPTAVAVNMGDITAAGEYIVEGVVTAISTASVYLDDGTGVVSINYGKNAVPKTYQVGQKYKVTGQASAYYGEYQFAADSVIEESTKDVAKTFLATPTITSLETLQADTKETRNLVAFSGNLVCKQNGNYKNFYFNGDTTTPAISPKNPLSTFTYEVGGEYAITGYLASWNSSGSYFSLYVASMERVVYAVESISLDKTEANVPCGESTTLVASILPAAADQSVTWTSDKPEVATVDGGVVTGVSEGIAVITAASVSDPTKTATATVEVTKIPASGDTVVKTINTYASEMTLSEDRLNLSIASGKATFNLFKNTAKSAIRTSDTDHVRCYQGSKVTVSVVDAKLVSVVFTATRSDYLAPSTWENGTAVTEGLVTTVTAGEAVTSVSAVCATQARFNKVVVTYVLD